MATQTTTMPRTAAQATTAYYEANPAIRMLRAGLAASQRLWPSLAVRVAYRLFGTPFPLKWSQRRASPGEGWQREQWAFEDGSVALYRRSDVASTAAQPREGADVSAVADTPVTLLAHGWGGHAGQMQALADALAASGRQALILELPAHGHNAGSVSNLPQFARAIEYAVARLQQQGVRVDALAAHSLGANAAAFAASRGLAVERLVLLAPPASPHVYTQLFANAFGLSEATRAAMQRRIEAREGIVMQQFEPAAVGPRIHVPTLVVHDRGDSINRFADGEEFSAAIAGARLHASDGLGHRKILRDPAVLGEVARFVAGA